ncbi:terminase family protein [Bradyrhizobium sp. dw_78]|uniref:terminase large subunit domain-containing protein n=1 Tax=Bradyrhizobium sp. dw_78 TaxID=2719793 RepID=UPI00201BFE45|nr:terminase family protein [Bradyrhizobium sp. dw_78]
MLAANRVGKTVAGAFETANHALGEYPDFWPGHRFDGPVRIWAAGERAETVRDILQAELLGPPGSFGTGMLPKKSIVRVTARRGIPDAIQDIYVKRKDGGQSVIQFKSFEAGIEAFMGTSQDFIWLDEEPPLDVYTECLMRTMTTRGLVLCTFTPLLGLSDVVKHFMPGGQIPADQEPILDALLAA